MLKRTVIICGLSLTALLLPPALHAQENATLVLRSGERISGELLDHGGVGFTMRVGGQQRQIPTSDVAVVEFTGGDLTAVQRTKLQSGQPFVVLRDGTVVDGRLFDVGGARPLRISVDTPSGQRNFPSSEVARIYFAVPGGGAAAVAAGEGAQPAGAVVVRVNANQPWTDTGIAVRRGDRVTFHATGDIDIMTGAGMSAGPAGTPAVQSGSYPVEGSSAGALIGRIGNSRPFAIGSNTQPITMPVNGRLFLGINDNHFADNSGAFSVGVTKQAR